MPKVIPLSNFKKLTNSKLINKYIPIVYKLRNNNSLVTTINEKKYNALDLTINVKKYNALDPTIKTKYEILAYYNTSNGIPINNFLKNKKQKISNNIITHEEYMKLSNEMKGLYEELQQKDITIAPLNIIKSINKSAFNKLTNTKNTKNKNSYTEHEHVHIGQQQYVPRSYRKKIYILSSYKKTLNNKKKKENRETRNSEILSSIVIGQSVYNELSEEHRNKYIKIIIKVNQEMYFRKDSLVINEEQYNAKESFLKSYYTILQIPGHFSNISKRYVPNGTDTIYYDLIKEDLFRAVNTSFQNQF